MDLTGEINRLAGIPYSERIGIAGAANLWAGTTGLELVGALNVKAGLPSNGTALELNGVLRRLGLSGYEQGGLTRGGAPGPGDAAGGGLNNVLRLPGITGNYVSTPDSAAISITGDIDIRVRVALDDWTPSATQSILAKQSGATQRSYRLDIEIGTGRPFLGYSIDGSTNINTVSTVGTGFTDGSVGWVRVTRVAATGICNFYTSSDGLTWTQLGAANVAGTSGNLYDSTSPIEIGSVNGGTIQPLAGKVYYAEVRNGINGPIVAAFDATTVPVRGDRLPTTVADAYGNTYTVNGSDWWWGTYTGTQRFTQAIQLDEQYVYFPGTAGNYASTPDSAALSITGDIDLRAKIAPDTWTPAVAQIPVAKYIFGANGRSYGIRLETTGQLTLLYSTAAQAGSVGNTRSSAIVPFTAGQTGWIRVTLDVDNGAAGHDVKFYTSTDGVTWTQLGTTVTTAGVADIYDSATQVTIGGDGSGTALFAGKVYYAEIRNGIGGSVVGQFGPQQAATTAVRTPTTFTAFNTSETWTLNGSAWNWGVQPITQITTPDSAALSVTGDIDIRAQATLSDWRMPGRVLVHKRSSNAGYTFRLASVGRLEFVLADGTTQFFKQATTDVPFTAGQKGWVRATVDVDNGAVGWDLKFYTSTDGVTWVQLGSTVTTTLTTSIGDSTSVLAVGGTESGSIHLDGTIHYVEIRNGIAGTVVGVFNPNILKYPSGQTPTTLGSPTGETWTISGSGWRWTEQAI